MSHRLPVDEAIPTDALPPKPRRPHFFPIIGEVRTPTTPLEKFMFNAASFTALGVFAGTVQAWFNDYRKVPRILFRESLRQHMKYFRGPFVLVTAAGLIFSATSAYFDYHNQENEKPHHVPKDQTLRQRVIAGALAGSTIGMHTQKYTHSVQGAAFIGFLTWFWFYYQYERGDYYVKMSWRLHEQTYKKKPEEEMPDYLRNYKVNNRRMIYSMYHEDRVDKEPIEKKPILYTEE
jgi:hypothetical protein